METEKLLERFTEYIANYMIANKDDIVSSFMQILVDENVQKKITQQAREIKQSNL